MIQLLQRLLPTLALILAVATHARAELPEMHRGFWHPVNSNLVLRVTAEGELTLLNSGEKGTVTVDEAGKLEGTFGETPLRGNFGDGKLWLRSSADTVPSQVELLEFRKLTEEAARELIGFYRKPRAPIAGDLAVAFRGSVGEAIRQRLSLLAESVAIHCMEHAVEKAENLADLVGPEKQLSALPSIDGEDYRKLDLTPNTPWSVESATGMEVKLEQ